MKSAVIMRFLLLLCLFLSLGSLQAQLKTLEEYQKEMEEQFHKESWWYRTFNRYEVNPGFSKYSAGVAQSQPLIGWSDVHPGIGMRYHQKHLELGYATWTGKVDSDSAATSFQRFSIGYFTPVNKLRFGNRYLDVRGFLFQPTFSLGYTHTNSSPGIYAAPGVHFQVPFGLIGARANVEYTFAGGFNVFPEISLQLDALRTLLDGRVKKIGSGTSSYSTASPIGGGWYSVKTTTYQYDVHMKVIQPLWGITPRIGMSLSKYSPDPYMNTGIGISGRINFLAGDIHVDKGKLTTGVVSNTIDLDETVKNNFDNDRVRGTVNTTEITFEAGMNIPGLIRSLFHKSAISSLSVSDTPLNRLNFHLGVTYFVPGKVEYFNADSAVSYTNQFFADNPTIERNAINDPLIHEKEWGVTYGVSYEMGAIGLRINNKLTKTIGKGTTVDVYYILPIVKIMKAYGRKDKGG